MKDLMKKYEERFKNFKKEVPPEEHLKFLKDLIRLSGERWKGKPYPKDIDTATDLSDEETIYWLQRLVRLPDWTS